MVRIMMFRLAAGCCVVGTLVVISPERHGALTPALPGQTLVSLAGTVGTSLAARALAPAPAATARRDAAGSPADAAQAALADLIVREAVAQGTGRARDALSAALGRHVELAPERPGAEPSHGRDTLTPRDRLPPWRGSVPKS
jgi:hypothetical protein